MTCIASCMMSAFLAFSCTSDEFFGIKEDYEGIEYPILQDIAHSAEYIEYQKQSILSMVELRSLDTTKCVFYDTINGKRILVSPQKTSIRTVLDAKRKVVELFPEFEEATITEKRQIRQIAMMDNNQLRKLSKKYSLYSRTMTKSSSGETDAHRFAMLVSCERQELDDDMYCFYAEGYTNNWYIDDDYWVSVECALSYTESMKQETGGYGFDSDGSGIWITSSEADIGHIRRIAVPNESNNGQWQDPWPTFEFHVHPSCVLIPSEGDWSTYYNQSVNGLWHLIFDLEGNYSAFYI